MIINIISRITHLYKNHQLRQSVELFLSSIITVILSFYIHKYLANYFSHEDYGSFNVLLRLFSILLIVFNFGLIQTGMRLLIQSNSNIYNRRVYGEILILTLFIFLIPRCKELYMILLLILSHN